MVALVGEELSSAPVPVFKPLGYNDQLVGGQEQGDDVLQGLRAAAIPIGAWLWPLASGNVRCRRSSWNIGCPPGNVGYDPRSIGCDRSSIGYTPGNVGYEPSNVGRAPANVESVPSNVGSAPSNVGSIPSNVGSVPRHIGDDPRSIGSDPRRIGNLPGDPCVSTCRNWVTLCRSQA